MRTTTMTFLIAIVPSFAAAQSADGTPDPMQGFSAQGRIQAEATLQAAREGGLPQQPLYAVMLEGQAKGAAEAQMLEAEQETLDRLAVAQGALVEAGRAEPTDAEVTHGASLLAQGMTRAELGAIAERTPSDQSLVTAFDVAAQAGVGVGVVSSAGGAGTAGSASAAADLSAGGSAAVLPATVSANAAIGAGVLAR
jgi:hypothetical protein